MDELLSVKQVVGHLQDCCESFVDREEEVFLVKQTVSIMLVLFYPRIKLEPLHRAQWSAAFIHLCEVGSSWILVK